MGLIPVVFGRKGRETNAIFCLIREKHPDFFNICNANKSVC